MRICPMLEGMPDTRTHARCLKKTPLRTIFEKRKPMQCLIEAVTVKQVLSSVNPTCIFESDAGFSPFQIVRNAHFFRHCHLGRQLGRTARQSRASPRIPVHLRTALLPRTRKARRAPGRPTGFRLRICANRKCGSCADAGLTPARRLRARRARRQRSAAPPSRCRTRCRRAS